MSTQKVLEDQMKALGNIYTTLEKEKAKLMARATPEEIKAAEAIVAKHPISKEYAKGREELENFKFNV